MQCARDISRVTAHAVLVNHAPARVVSSPQYLSVCSSVAFNAHTHIPFFASLQRSGSPVLSSLCHASQGAIDMQLIGARLIVLCPSASYGLQWKAGYLRAASEPVLELVHLLRPDIQVRGDGE